MKKRISILSILLLLGMTVYAQTDIPQVMQSILPVSKAKSDKGVYTNDRIRLYNRLIKEMCAEKGVKYLDVYQAVVNSSGALPDDAAVDGVHLKMAYCKKWANYLRAHTA